MRNFMRIAMAVFIAMAVRAPAQAQPGIQDAMPAFYPALKSRLTYPMAWTAAQTDPAAWRSAGRAKVWEATLQTPDGTPFKPQLISETDRGAYVVRRIAFNLTADVRANALLLVPKGPGKFPAALMLHDHGAKFDIGKEKAIEPADDPVRAVSARGWAAKYFSGRFPGDELARRGYVVLAVDALGFGERGPMTAEMQQALAANAFNLGTSLAGIMALEDARAAQFLAALPEVDASRVAAVGFSMGAFRAWQVAALSDSVTAVVAVNWMATAQGLMVPGNNQLRGGSAWNMIHPGLLRYLDYPDVASLAAPKPALFLAGQADKLFPIDAVHDAFGKLRSVWHAWDADARLELRVLPGGHEFGEAAQSLAFDWLDRQFGNTTPH
jgi:dienelactone hydrolase